MENRTISADEARRIHDALFPGVNYLYRLRDRMAKAGFATDDPVYQLVCKAYDASLSLRHEMHHKARKTGMGCPAKE